uniref:ABC transporter domain-containing protein n=1 Tax=Fagus sylvatica TaxID=28930 RepID=A0A2N9GFS1_FAGSY
MAQMVGASEIELAENARTLRSLLIETRIIELANKRRLHSLLQHHNFSFHSSFTFSSDKDDVADHEYALQWAPIERLPAFERLRTSLFDKDDEKGKRVIDVTKLGALERHIFIEKLIKNIEDDNLRTSWPIFSKLILTSSMATMQTVEFAKLLGTKSRQAKISIIDDVSGIIKPGRLAGKISYNGYKLEEFVPQKTSAYISQYDQHIPEMTVREILDFSACCQGVVSRADVILEVSKREKEAGIVPDPDIDTYMKMPYHFMSIAAMASQILGLDICADTLVGDATRRGISSGEKRRLTTGEMIVGPTKALFMDEITNGVDSSTAFQIVTCIQQLVHITDATALVSLLQPAPETFDLFDDLILMCPERKGVADFIQEVISRKDQAQYWCHMEVPYSYVSVDMFSRKFKESRYGKKIEEDLSKPYDKSQSLKDALSFSVYSLSKWEHF